MSVRYDFTCQNGHDFTLWSDDARLCPTCGSEFLKRIFIEPVAINTQKSKAIDQIVRRELENRGITNIRTDGHEGDKAQITYKTPPEKLAAQKIERDFPQMNDPTGLDKAKQQVFTRWSNLGVKGVIGMGLKNEFLTSNIPVTTTVKNGKIQGHGTFAPNTYGMNDKQMVDRKRVKDPENLKLKKS